MPLTFEELSKSLTEANFKSAPGIDGYSNRFIRQFWHIFGIPLHRCCTQSMNEGDLLETFTTAQNKIIPKKGDKSKIKNWRQISLLSNFYKIISRAVNNRLKSVVNRVLSRSQKGFNKGRQIQEVIINLSENINFCQKNGIEGAMICVDLLLSYFS
jgi:Reverse transcriptase (RNA-dependent DNA polymerase)